MLSSLLLHQRCQSTEKVLHAWLGSVRSPSTNNSTTRGTTDRSPSNRSSSSISHHPQSNQQPQSALSGRTKCRVERSLLWEITGSLAAVGNDLRVTNQLLFSKTKIIIKQNVFNCAHTKGSRPTSSIQC